MSRENKTGTPDISEFVTELRNSRIRISELLDKAWELCGDYVGKKAFNDYDWVKDAREQLETIDKLLWTLQ